jgi:flagellar biosynthesis/type III secretory pathway protein FliH
MADEKKTKKEKPATAKAEGKPEAKSEAKSEGKAEAKTEGKAEAPVEAKSEAPKNYSRGEGQKAVTQAYKDNWNAIFGKKKR